MVTHAPAATSQRRRRLTRLMAAAGLTAVLAVPAASAQAAPGAWLHWTTTHVKGSKGTFTWDVTTPRFTRPARPSAVANQRVRASVTATVDATARDHERQASSGDKTAETLTGTGAVTTNDGRTVQVRLDYADYDAGAAHPTDVVNTIVLGARTGRPITLAQVFTSPAHAFTVLKPQIEHIAAAKGEPVTETSGLAPTTANWSAWQSTPAGMVFAFQDYQLGGHGIRTYTVPWSVVRPLLTPSATALLAPAKG